jgi:hypothetical protein
MGSIRAHVQNGSANFDFLKLGRSSKDRMLTPTMAATSSYVMVASILDGDFFAFDYKARMNKIKLVQRGTH